MIDIKRVGEILKNTQKLYQEFLLDELARKMYAAYGESTGGKNFQGNEMPKWEELPDRIQTAWRASAKAAVNELLSLVMLPTLP